MSGNELMLLFIQENSPTKKINKLMDIASHSEPGACCGLNQKYLVTVELCVADRNIPQNNLSGRINAECIVDCDEYNKWIERRNAIKWLS